MSKERISVLADLSTIKLQLRKDEKFSQGIRLYAVYQIKRGMKAKELEELYGVSHKSICNWVHIYNNEGLAGLTDKPRSGRPPKLDAGQKSVLREVILRSPEEVGYATATWTGPMVIDYIKQRYNVEYKKAQIYNLLRGMGFSFQRGRAFYPESTGREETVLSIKKLRQRPADSVVVFEDEASLSNTVVLDNVRYHHAKRLKPVLEKYKSMIELVFLPPYSPDLNSIERVWWLMRKTITHNRWVKTMEQRIVDFENWSKHTPTDCIEKVCSLTENSY